MPDHPFHVAGGVFLGHSPARPEIDASFLTRPKAELPDLAEAASTSRRRKLWEIPHKFHCPVVGSCFAVKELRSLMHKVMHLPRDTSDFVLHTTAVGACENRSRLAELLHKTLEKRYALTIRRFAASKTADGVRQLWREATASGVELPGALWAAWTHPACDSLLEHEIYGDIHMIQHQVGTGARADLKTLQALRTENAELRRQVEVLRQDAEAARHEKAGETRALGERLTELRAEQAGRDACIARLSAELRRVQETRQAGDAAGYAEAMRASFNMDDDGTLSRFSNGDLRADLDSVVVGSKVTKDTDLAEALRSYYANLTEYDRVKEFISLSFGTVDTSSTAFADAVYSALLEDSGMQLLFYMNGMWTVKGWQIKDDYAPAVRGATDLFAEYLANAVNHEKIKSETNDRLVAMGGQALADALEALGDTDAAQAALTAAEEMANNAQSTVSSGSDVVSAARENLQTNFNVKVFQLILLIAAGLAAFMLVFSMVMFVVHRKEN